MYIMDDGIRLNARLDRPEGGGRCPLAVVIHGFTGNMEERHIQAVCRTLNGAGYATLRADMYGHGHSGGEFRNHTLYKWLTNAMTLIDYARGLDFVTNLYLCGHSQGGLTVMLAAQLKRDVIKGIIPLSPAWMIPEGARQGFLLGRQFDPEHIPEEIPSWDGNGLNGNYVRVAQTIRVEEAIAAYTGPVLIVQGDEDEAVPVRYATEAARLYRNARLVLVPGDDHCFNRHLDQMLQAVKEWALERKG